MKKEEISIRIVDDDGLWDSFVSASPQGTVFSRSPWLTAVAGVQGGQVVRLGAFYEGVISAGVSFIGISRSGLKKAVSPILSPYGGMIYRHQPGENEEPDTASLSLLLAERLIAHIERRYHQITFSHSPAFFDVRPYSWRGWDTRVRYTYRLDITDPAQAIERFRKRVHHLINRGSRTFSLQPAMSAGTIGDMYEQTFRRQGEPPPVSAKQVAALIERLSTSGLIDIMTAVDQDGEAAGVLVNALGHETVYELVNGTTAENRHAGVYAFINHEAVLRYASTHRTLDLVGANIPAIAFFKRGFGGRLTPYYVTERYSSAAAKWAFATYTRMRALLHR